MGMKKLIVTVASIVMLSMLTAGLAISWLCYTASGLQFALLQLNHLPNLNVQVEGVTGRLAGPLHVGHIALEHQRVRVDVEDLDIDLTPALLLGGLIEINRLSAAQISVTLKPPLSNQPDQPVHFLPAFLRISVDEFAIKQASYVHTNGYTVVATPLQGAAELSRSRLRVQKLNAITREFDTRGEVVLDSDRVLTLQADLQADYKLSNGPVLRGDITASGPVTGARRELRLSTLLHQPHEARLSGVLAFSESGWSLQGNATAEKVLLDAWWQQPAFSFSKLDIKFNFSDAGMHYDGNVVIPEWSPVLMHVDADTSYAKRVFALDSINVSVPQKRIDAHATGRITLQTVGKPLLELQGNWSGLQWPIHAPAAQVVFTSALGKFSLHGAEPYEFDVTGRVASAHWPESGLHAIGQLSPGKIKVSHYQLNTLNGIATGTATVSLDTPRTWQFELVGQNLDPAGLYADWPGSLNVKAIGSGRGFDSSALFDVSVQALKGRLRNQAVNLTGRLRHDGKEWLAQAIDAGWGRARLTAQGSIGRQNNLHWNLNVPVLKELHPDLAGDVNMTGALSGTADEPQLSLQTQAARFIYGDWQTQNLKLDSHLDLSDHSSSSIDVSATRILSGSRGLERVHLTGEGRSASHQLRLQGTLASAPLPAGMQLDLQLTGAYAAQQWHGSVKELQVVDTDKVTRVSLVQAGEMMLSSHQADAQQMCLTVDGGRVCANGQLQRTDQGDIGWHTHLSLQALPLTISNSALTNSAHLQTRVSGQLELSAAPALPWQGTADMQLEQAGIHYTAISGRDEVLPIRLGELHMNADARSVQTTGELRIGEQTVSTLSAMVNRSAGTSLADSPLTGVLTLSSSDAKLIPVFVTEVDRASGTLAAALQLSGTAAAPRFSGIIRLLKGELDFYQLNLALRDMEFNAQVNTDQLQFMAQANAGEGLLNGTGELSWSDAKLSGNLQLKGNRLLVADLPEYRVLASPDLRFDINDRNINVKGEVLIPEARLQPREVVGAVQLSADAHFKDETLLERKQSGWIINSDASIRLGDKISFAGLGLQGRLSGEVMTRLHTGDIPAGSGELSVNDGSYEIYGQKLDIKRGRLIYDSTPLGDPGLDIQAERKIETTTVGVNVRGLLRAPRLQFYSSPAMSQTQIVSYLLIGKPLDELQTGEATTVRSASSTLAIQGGGYLASQLGRRIGLEQVGVETDSRNQSSLVLGKFLSPRLFVSYGISLTQAINTVKLRYTLSDHWSVKTEVGEARSADIEFKIER